MPGLIKQNGLYDGLLYDGLLEDGIIPSSGVPLWTPAQITTIAWYDASDASTITEAAGSVSQIDDKGTAALYHLSQGTGFRQPKTGTRTHNGLNVLDFDGNDYMLRGSFPVPASGDISFFIVYGVDSVSATTDSLFSMDGAAADFQLQSASASTYAAFCNGAGGFSNITYSGAPHNGPAILNMRAAFTSNVHEGFVDGTSRGSTTYAVKLSGVDFKLFTNRGVSTQLNGFMCELVIVEDCTATCRQMMEGYLAHKWGLAANLPGGHPYKLTPPTL